MTELFIDGISVPLPKNFSIQVKRENPYFNKNGEYTYDITLSMQERTVAELYGHLNRLNNTKEVPTKRSAILKANNRVYCQGTEIVTGWNEKEVNIQIASGNSELNYVIGSDLMLSSLDMKTTYVNTTNFDCIEKYYPDMEYAAIPVYDRSNGVIANPWVFYDMDDDNANFELGMENSSHFYPMPYLCCYLEELFSALGYTVSTNQIKDTIFCDLLLIHTEATSTWSKMFPGWTVGDFLGEIEKLLNVSFLVNNKNKTVDILLNAAFYNGGTTVHVRSVEDTYEVEVEEEPEVEQLKQANLTYALPSSSKWNHQRIPKGMMALLRQEEIPETFDISDIPANVTASTRWQQWFSKPGHQRTDTIYTDVLDGTQLIYVWSLLEQFGIYTFKVVNQLADLEREDATDTIEIKIRPVEIAYECEIPLYGSQHNKTGYATPQMATVDSSNFEPSDGEENNSESSSYFDQLAERTYSDDKEGDSTLMLAFYRGLVDESAGVWPAYPRPYTLEYEAAIGSIHTNTIGQSLSLKTLDEQLYQDSYEIDFVHGVRIKSHDVNLYDPRCVFEINNKRYICRELEYTLDANGRKGAWEGTFHPIKMDDTAADSRWILTDAKWRDGGVWIDNGRWLDE